jgi:hypothetical protein
MVTLCTAVLNKSVKISEPCLLQLMCTGAEYLGLIKNYSDKFSSNSAYVA